MCSRHVEPGAGASYASVSCEGEQDALYVMDAPRHIITDMFWAEISARCDEMARWNLRLAKRDAPDMAVGAYANARRWHRIGDYAIARLLRRVEA